MDNTTGAGDTGGAQDKELQIWPQEVCRFAYTLNNSQPVRCTWISDQPLFYADFDEVEEDDFLLDDPVLQALERDIADLREKANAYDKIAKEFEISEADKINLFRMDAEEACALNIPSSQDKLGHLLTMLKDSRLASQYLSFAQLNEIELRLSNQVVDAAYDREARLILVREDMDPVEQTLLAARELRRMYQHRHGAGLHPLALHPDFAVLVNRAQTADLAVSMVRVAWELHLAGHKDVWARIEHSPSADLGRAFAREAITDFRSIQNGTAARTTFESWFLSERCRKADRLLIQQMLADYQGYSFSDNIEASRLIAIDLIKALGSMPFGQNYTESVVSQIMVDPIFTDVRDRSNANFLWFIKFERSFTEAEKEVASKKEAKKQAKAQILEFPQHKSAHSSKSRSAAGIKGQGQVVELSRVGQD